MPLRAAILGTVLVLAGCGSGAGTGAGAADPPPSPRAPLEVGVPDPVLVPPPVTPPCDPRRNLTPSTLPKAGAMPEGTTMRAIQNRGFLEVGVDQNTRMFSAPNPDTRVLEGFDIDVAREVAEAIFGDPNRVRLRVIPPGQRLDVLVNRKVDMVVHTLTITCDRWQQVDFSSGYLEDSLRLLVPKNSPVKSLEDLAGQYVCVSKNTTPERRVAESKARVYEVADRTDCLVALQEGRVAAVHTNAALLAGLAEQDPLLKMVGESDLNEVSAIAVPKGETDFVRFLNATIERMKSDGTWQRMYDRWFRAALGTGTPPKTTYSG